MKTDDDKKKIAAQMLLKRLSLVAMDAMVLLICGVLAHYLVFGSLAQFNWLFLSAIIAFQIIVFAATRVYRTRIKDSSVDLVVRIVFSSLPVWVVVFLYASFAYGGTSDMARCTVVFAAFGILGTLGARILFRFVNQKSSQRKMNGKPKALVYGAGETGSTIARMAAKNKFDYSIIGFIDDKPELKGELIQGVPVLGDIDDLAVILSKDQIDTLIIAISAISSEKMQRSVELAKHLAINVKVVPNLFESGRKAGDVSIRDIDFADLLGRSLAPIQRDPIAHMLDGKTVLVTGAGGSIGSEICRQIVSFSPSKLLVLDIDESELHDLCLRLLNYKHEWSESVFPILCDIRDRAKVQRIFDQYKPDVVFHAAAIKHVPMSELYPEEAIRTNIGGSFNVLSAARNAGSEKVVVISTDKAVNPTNVMGATKRVVEMMASAMSTDRTQMCAVRFGNVIGSRGSMLPLFLEEIKAGVPITVTDKRIIRYFMAIPEAVGLVFRAATIANGGEVMVLDMGNPVNIYNFAQKLIDIFGDGRSTIIVTGLRPGEKLYEELLANKDTTIPTENAKIFKAKVTSVLDPEGLEQRIDALMAEDCAQMVARLHEIVPEWHVPVSSGTEPLCPQERS